MKPSIFHPRVISTPASARSSTVSGVFRSGYRGTGRRTIITPRVFTETRFLTGFVHHDRLVCQIEIHETPILQATRTMEKVRGRRITKGGRKGCEGFQYGMAAWFKRGRPVEKTGYGIQTAKCEAPHAPPPPPSETLWISRLACNHSIASWKDSGVYKRYTNHVSLSKLS